MIPILFHTGTHGHYVEFVLNKVIHGHKIYRSDPLGVLGTSHAQQLDRNYLKHLTFKCKHPNNNIIEHKPFLKIDFDSSDDLFVLQLSLKRTGDQNIDIDTLDQGTYFQLFGKYGLDGKAGGPQQLINDINQFTDLTPYYNIKDPSWPNINSVNEFYNLPQHILDECIQVFGFCPIQITADRPDAPRWVLRSIFKSWFYNQSRRPSTIMSYLDGYKTSYKLQLQNLYDTAIFKQEILQIGKFFNIEMNLDNFSTQIHQEFINRIPYKDSKYNTEKVINSISNHEHFQIKLNVVEEGYVNYCVETTYGITMPEETEQYFKDTSELSAYVKNEL